MIPYFQFTSFQIGPLTIQVWGLMVALGILLGTIVSAKFAERMGGSKERIYDIAFWIILFSLIGARAFHVFVYDPAYYLKNLDQIIKFWEGGMSIMGGFLGAILGYFVSCKYYKLNWREYMNYAIYGLPLGLGCGRIGCFLIHDHPGTLTNSPLGYKDANGQVRHDLGLYLSINGILMALAFFYLGRKKRSDFFFVQIFLIWYGCVRFSLDFLRIIDKRYFGLTPAQYISLLMVICGSYWLIQSRNNKENK